MTSYKNHHKIVGPPGIPTRAVATNAFCACGLVILRCGSFHRDACNNPQCCRCFCVGTQLTPPGGA